MTKPHPCAKLQCWMDPGSVTRQKAKELIGERLEAQYARWQQQRSSRPLKYRRALDPTVEDVRALCLWLRRQAKHERVLFHYNGHGVPRPTMNGEIWVFDKNHTEYIPLSVSDLRQWMGKPSIVVLDCSSAGILIPMLTSPLPNSQENEGPSSSTNNDPDDNMEAAASHWVRDTIVLCPTSEQEWLPMHPDYPADIFTSCLTTPIQIGLQWFIRRNRHSMGTLDPEVVHSIPGKANDRKTPLGELNWIFTAVTDSIAWNVLPKPLFQRLFRQDLLVASMFRNFLLADRILRSLNCTPKSYPPLPPGVADHPMWHAWDLACETCLFSLMKDGLIGSNMASPSLSVPSVVTDAPENASSKANKSPLTSPPTVVVSSVSSPFFSEQLSAFECWLEFAAIHKASLDDSNKSSFQLESPEQLPVVLQVLLSQVHRVRALLLLRRFLDLGPWAVNLSLSLGIFPYVMKLLQSPEYKSLLVSIWASILKFDCSCQVDLVKDGALSHFTQPLMPWSGEVPMDGPKQRTLSAYCLAATCHNYTNAQNESIRQNLHGHISSLLTQYTTTCDQSDGGAMSEKTLPAAARLWLCICLGNLVKKNLDAQREAIGTNAHLCLFARLDDPSPAVRSAACYALGCLLQYQPRKPIPPSKNGMSPAAPQQAVSPLDPRNPQPVSPFHTGGQVLVPQHMSATTLTVPAALTATAVLSGQMHQNPSHPPQPSNQPMWNIPQHQQMNPIKGMMPYHGQMMQPVEGSMPPQVQPGLRPPAIGGQPVSAGPQLGNQQQLFMRSQGIPNVAPIIGSPPVPGQFSPLNPIGHVRGYSDGQVVPSVQSVHPQNVREVSVYDDRRRIDLDLRIALDVTKLLEDGSPVVRYEVVMTYGSLVGKYLHVFLVVADEMSMPASSSAEGSKPELRRTMIRIPRGLSRTDLDKFSRVWKSIRTVQHDDTHPIVSAVATLLVSVVHERLLDARTKMVPRKTKNQTGMSHSNLAELSGIQEEDATNKAEPVGDSSPHESRQPGSPSRSPASSNLPFRRTATEVGSLYERNHTQTPPSNAKLSSATSEKNHEFIIPESKFYEWKKDSFIVSYDEDTEDDDLDQLDPLCPSGAALSYQERRSKIAHDYSMKLGDYFSSLIPRAPKSQNSVGAILEDEDEADEKDLALKGELKLKERKVLNNSGSDMTSILKFHSYEDVLAVCDNEAGVSIWNYETGEQSLSFQNGNPNGTRITSSFWVNEKNSSLLFVGCNDGSARIWNGILEENGSVLGDSPDMASSFFAVPPMSPDQRGSGLICDFQQISSRLIAGGNSNTISIWDLNNEKCSRSIPTETEACITTLTTTWDSDFETPSGGLHGMNPDVFVAGQSDGTLRIFDLRASNAASETPSKSRRHRRPERYTEHNRWVVSTSLTGYGRYELVSASIGGDIKAWDLRISSSLRTLEATRSPMTAFSAHKQIPIAAIGSHAQFVKIVTLEGETLQVARFHEQLPGHRIGPVSCLEFHKHKLVLAAGATNSLISIYKPKHGLSKMPM